MRKIYDFSIIRAGNPNHRKISKDSIKAKTDTLQFHIKIQKNANNSWVKSAFHIIQSDPSSRNFPNRETRFSISKNHKDTFHKIKYKMQINCSIHVSNFSLFLIIVFQNSKRKTFFYCLKINKSWKNNMTI